MTAPRRVTLVIFALLLPHGCGAAEESDAPATPGAPSTAPATRDAGVAATPAGLDALIAAGGSATFRSWGGKWQGADADADLTFLPGGAAHLTEYADGIGHFDGTYAITPAGTVTVTLPTFPDPWTVMVLRRDATSLRLDPATGGQPFVVGTRHGFTVAGGAATFCPFRPVDAAEGARVIDRMNPARPRG